jgi:hypothetical protein
MSETGGQVHDAIDRWEDKGLLDGDTATRLREELSEQESIVSHRLSQYVLASAGAIVLVIAGGVFLQWAWPILGAAGQALLLTLAGAGVLVGGILAEGRPRWRPASYLMQTAGLGLILWGYIHSERAWADQSAGGVVLGLLALATPIVLTARSMRRNVVMPAVHLATGLAFLAVFLDRATPLSSDAAVWVLDAVLVAAIVVLISLIRGDPELDRHPWALNTFVSAMGAGFVLVSITAWETLSLSDDAWLAIDVWWALSVGLTLWGVHRAPPGLRRGWFEHLLALEALGWILLGMITAHETLEGGHALAVIIVGGVGVIAFIHAARHGFNRLMMTASLCFIVPIFAWAVDAAGAVGAIVALVATAGFLFWASGRVLPQRTWDG